MKYDELLREQKEELEEQYEVYLSNNADDPEFEAPTFLEYAEGYDFTDSDFFCTANRSDRYMDIVFPYHSETITLGDEELRALEQKIGHIIYDYGDLIDVLHEFVDAEVDKFRAIA